MPEIVRAASRSTGRGAGDDVPCHRAMTLKAPPRLLPILEVAPPVVAPSGPRDPFAPEDERLEEFRP